MKYVLTLLLWASLLFAFGCGGDKSDSPSPSHLPAPTPVPVKRVPSPTTDLAKETGNNTSASPSFKTQTNGNVAAGNVSKLATRTLLYQGSNTKILAHLQAWFGSNQHMDVGYNSQSPAHIHAQLDDMQSRGIDGVVIDWYGKDSYEDTVAQNVRTDIDNGRKGFAFAIMLDQGLLRACSVCDPTNTVISALNYISSAYDASPNYLTYQGKYVVFEFGLERWNIDWDKVACKFPKALLWENSSGFSKPLSIGAFSWVSPIQNAPDGYESTGYLSDFYQAALKADGAAVGSAFKGFDDSLAQWGAHRKVYQNCGQMWLDSFTEANKYYSAEHQLPFLQLVTWNDYEEGTELETGIDGCNEVLATIYGNTLEWGTSGNKNVVAGYTVFGSEDGQHLFRLADLPPTASSFKVSSLPEGQYTFFVKMQAKPGILNKMSDPIAVHID